MAKDLSAVMRKLQLARQYPDMVRELTPSELADIVIVVLDQVKTIEKAISSKKLDLEKKIGNDITQYATNEKAALEALKREIQQKIDAGVSQLETSSTKLEQRVQEAINNIRDGEDGIVTEAEIAQAAQIASQLIELPDFEAMLTEAIQGNGALLRDALESLPEGDEQLSQEAVRGLVPKLKELQERIDRVVAGSGGTIGKNQVYNFIAQAVADGTIPAGGGGSVSDEAYGGSWDGVTDEAPSKNAVFDKIESLVLGSGTGDVVGPASAVDSNIAAFDTTTGKLIKDGGATIAQVRDRSTHTGTQTASTISDFDTEVSNNTDVAANTSARHSAVTIAAGRDYVTLSGQELTLGQVDLTTDVTGDLPFANIAQIPTNRILGRSTAGTGDVEELADGAVRGIIGLDTTDSPQFAGVNVGHANDTTIGRTSAGRINVEGTDVVLAGDNISSLTNDAGYITADDQNASEVPFTPTGNIAATNVQAAIEELDTEKQPLDADLTAIAAANNSAVLAATTASFTTADETKLDGIEAGADVTDSTNVLAAINGQDPVVNLITYDAARGKVTAGGNLGATETINFNDETNYTGTLDSNITFTFANATSGDDVTLYLSYDGTAQRTITWPTITWLDNATGAAPTAPAASGNVLVVTVRYIGTTYYGSATGNYAVYA